MTTEPVEPSPGKKPDRTWYYVGAAFVALWGAYLLFFLPSAPLPSPGQPRLEPPPRPITADYDWKLLDLDDKPVEFSRYRGKVVFLNMWATFCGPCVAEMPSIARLAANPKLKDVAFVCVSTDESVAPIRQFLAEKQWPMTILRVTELPPPAFVTDGLPVTFVIAADGRVVVFENGPAEWDDPSAVEFLQSLVTPKK